MTSRDFFKNLLIKNVAVQSATHAHLPVSRGRASRPKTCGDGTSFARLKDGRPILIRQIQRSDQALLEEGFGKLSSRSRVMRYLAPKKELSKSEIDLITDPTDMDDVTLGALAQNSAGDWRHPVGTSRFIRLSPGGDDAEIAVTIVDEYQRLGAGRILLAELIARARDCGITRLVAFVHSENKAMKALAQNFGGHVAERHETEVRLHIDLDV